MLSVDRQPMHHPSLLEVVRVFVRRIAEFGPQGGQNRRLVHPLVARRVYTRLRCIRRREGCWEAQAGRIRLCEWRRGVDSVR